MALERIINFFQTEDMQNRLANVILNDTSLQEDLNLDTPDNANYNSSKGLNYLAVAKVGILTFADYIHDIYIADGGWREDTWNWIFDPGYTLVDLVDAALGAIGDAVNAVKNAATSFVNGIKAGVEFIANAVISVLVSGISAGMNALIKSMLLLITSLDSSLTYLESGGIPGIDTGTNHEIILGSTSSGNNLQININGMTIQISDLISLAPKFQTLSISEPWEISLITIFTELLMVGSAFLSGQLIKKGSIGKGQLLFGGSLVASTIIEIITMSNYMNNDLSYEKENSLFLFESIFAFNFGQFLGTLTWLTNNDKKDHDITGRINDHTITKDFNRWWNSLYRVGWKSDAVTPNQQIPMFFYSLAISMGLLSIFNEALDFSLSSMISNIGFLIIGFVFGMLKSHLLASKAGSIAKEKADVRSRMDFEVESLVNRYDEWERDIKGINLVYFSLAQYLTMFIYSGSKILQIRSS